MSEETTAPAYKTESSIGGYTSRLLYACYTVMLLTCIAILLIGAYSGYFVRVFITIPVIIVLLDALFTDRTTVHIPPLMIFIMIALMWVILFGNFFNEDYIIAEEAVDFLFGVVMGLVGLTIAYSFIPAIPDIDLKRPFTMIFVSISVALSLFTVLSMVQYYLSMALGDPSAVMMRAFGPEGPAQTVDAVMYQLLFVTFGAFVISIAFYLGRRSAAVHQAVAKYMHVSHATIGIEEYELMEIKKALDSGENERVEYKSTLRTNLGTGEKDDKIERGVLKTLVAFLNSRGGTLLIGVADDGVVVGIDESSFESRDKMNLHLTNLITAHIGNEFLPYITFRMSEYDGKGIMRILCRKSNSPVFLHEGREESFYVRSGPSSVELHGTDTLNYVDNRFNKRIGRKSFKV